MSMIKPEVFTTSFFFVYVEYQHVNMVFAGMSIVSVSLMVGFSLFFGGGVFSFAAIQIPVLIEHELNMISQLLKWTWITVQNTLIATSSSSIETNLHSLPFEVHVQYDLHAGVKQKKTKQFTANIGN